MTHKIHVALHLSRRLLSEGLRSSRRLLLRAWGKRSQVSDLSGGRTRERENERERSVTTADGGGGWREGGSGRKAENVGGEGVCGRKAAAVAPRAVAYRVRGGG